MSKRKSKLMLAGVLGACAFSGMVLRLAWATPGAGISTTIIAGPSVLSGDLKVKSESDVNEVEFEAKVFSDLYVVHNKIVPGGYTGWHSHPGISFVRVRSGTATKYHERAPAGAGWRACGTDGAPRLRRERRRAIERFLERADRGFVRRPVRLDRAGGRHRARAQLRDDFLPRRGVGRHVLEVEAVECEVRVGRFAPLVMASNAVLVEDGPERRRRGGNRGGLRRRRRAGRRLRTRRLDVRDAQRHGAGRADNSDHAPS